METIKKKSEKYCGNKTESDEQQLQMFTESSQLCRGVSEGMMFVFV